MNKNHEMKRIHRRNINALEKIKVMLNFTDNQENAN